MKHGVIKFAITGVILLEGWALYLGYDGVLLTTVIGGLLGLAGLASNKPKFLGGEENARRRR